MFTVFLQTQAAVFPRLSHCSRVIRMHTAGGVVAGIIFPNHPGGERKESEVEASNQLSISYGRAPRLQVDNLLSFLISRAQPNYGWTACRQQLALWG
jgi:hypothetical protein